MLGALFLVVWRKIHPLSFKWICVTIALATLYSIEQKASAQPPGIITTLAGTGAFGCSGDGDPASSAELNEPYDVAVDNTGNVYIADSGCSRIQKVAADTGLITTVAGGKFGYGGDGGPATSAAMGNPAGIAVDSNGNIYIADWINNRIRKVDASTGIITTVAGDGKSCIFGCSSIGDGGPATSAELWAPMGVAVDSAGDLYIADSLDFRVRKVNASTGIISTVAGGPNSRDDDFGDNGPATSAGLAGPIAVALDSIGNLYIVDVVSSTVRKVNATTQIITTIAGIASDRWGFSGDGGPATSARLAFPLGVQVDSDGNIFIADSDNNRIREVAGNTGIIITVAGDGKACLFGCSSVGDGGPATNAELTSPSGVAIDSMGNLYIADRFDNRIRAVAKIAAGTAPVAAAVVLSPAELAFGDQSENIPSTAQLVTLQNTGNGTLNILSISIGGTDPSDFSQTNNCGSALQPNSSCTVLVTFTPQSVGDFSATLSITDNATGGSQAVGLSGTGTSVSQADMITTFAGNGQNGYSGDSGPALNAALNSPTGVAIDGAGNLYIADEGNNRIREVAAVTGIISTVAGNGTCNGQYGVGNGGPATSAQLCSPWHVAVDSAGDLYIAEWSDVRMVAAGTGIISTVAGNGTAGYSGDGGLAVNAELNGAIGVAVDGNGDIFIADEENGRIREVVAGTGIITTIAGSGYCGTSGASTLLCSPDDILVDSAGDLYVADSGYNNISTPGGDRILKVAARTEAITVLAGTGVFGFSGDGSAATNAELNSPFGLALDSSGNLYITDTGNERIREVNATSGIINTIVGDGTAGYSGDGGTATNAELDDPNGIVLDNLGNLYIADTGNNRIREVAGIAAAISNPSSTSSQ